MEIFFGEIYNIHKNQKDPVTQDPEPKTHQRKYGGGVNYFVTDPPVDRTMQLGTPRQALSSSALMSPNL